MKGNVLLNDCRKQNSDLELGNCIGYISGVVDYEATIAHWSKIHRDRGVFCIPSGVTRDQLRKIVIKRLEARPEALHFEAASLVVSALHDAFPCKSD